jgi:hypothetical protein
MDEYYKKYEQFDYYDTVLGCNVPGDVVDEFFDLFDSKGDLMDREYELYKLVKQIKKQPDVIANKGKYYLIGTGGKDHKLHEIAHGMYYVIPEYQEAQDIITAKWKSADKAKQGLLDLGYANYVYIIRDEIQAYFATEDEDYLEDTLDYKPAWRKPKAYVNNFTKYAKKHKLKLPRKKPVTKKKKAAKA